MPNKPVLQPASITERCHAILCGLVGNDRHGWGVVCGIPLFVGIGLFSAVPMLWVKLLILRWTIMVIFRTTLLIHNEEWGYQNRPSSIDLIILPCAIFFWLFLPSMAYYHCSMEIFQWCGSKLVGFLAMPSLVLVPSLSYYLVSNYPLGTVIDLDSRKCESTIGYLISELAVVIVYTLVLVILFLFILQGSFLLQELLK